MATVRKSNALRAAEKRITELESAVKSAESTKTMYSNMYSEIKKEVDGLHAILDSLEIPRKGPDAYSNDYPLSVRLFAWSMKRENR